MAKGSLGVQVLIAFLLGSAVGLFFGPYAAVLKPIGEAYTMLMQMAVLPYICLSLIHGLGSISPQTGKKIFRCGWAHLLTLWLLIFGVVLLLAQLIPTPQAPLIHADGTNAFTSHFADNFLLYLIPKNPFYDIANNIAPAVALFGLIGGVALMHIEKKEPLIGTLERVNVTIEKILEWLGILSPIAAFVYMAIAFGTIRFEEFPKIEVYLLSYTLTAFFFTLVILPLLLSRLTSLSFRDALRVIWTVCLIPFITGLSTTILPFLNLYLKRLSHQHVAHVGFRETSQTILPIAYSFGNIGNVMNLFSILFLGFYFRHPFSGVEQFLLSLMTVPLSIGSSMSSANSVLFLVQQIGLPAAAADFFLEIKPITTHFQVLISAGSILVLIILSLYAYYGLLKIKGKQLITGLGLSLALFAACIFSFKSTLPLTDNYQNLFLSHKITDVIADPVSATILPPVSKEEAEALPTFNPTLKHIIASGVLRVGVDVEAIPFSYYNQDHQLVGYDVAYAYQLARDLDCKLEFIPFHIADLETLINHHVFDIGIGAIIMSEERLFTMDFSTPYAEDDNVLIVPEAKKRHFLHLAEVVDKKGLKIGAGGAQYPIAKKHFPHAELIYIDQMQLLKNGAIDASFWSATPGFVWCLTEPRFVAIDYGSLLGKAYFAYPIPHNSTEFRTFINNWLVLKEESGFKARMHSYWIEGNPGKERPPRWSILRNVLHWVH